MKTIKKKLALTILIASILLNQSKVTAQSCLYTGGGPPRTELQSWPYLDFTNGGTGACSAAGTFNLTGVGVNMTTPNYMLDILCDPTTTPPTNMDVNIGCPNCTPANSVGYRIGDSMMLWHNGIQSSLFVGSFAGGGPILQPGGVENTFIGNLAGRHNSNPTTLIGDGFANTYVGYAAGYGQPPNPMVTPGDSNVYIGANSGFNNTYASDNVFVGSQSGYSNQSGDSGVMVGNHAGYSNVNGWGNVFMGNCSGYSNVYGQQSVLIGDRCGFNNNASWNTFAGNHCGYYTTDGNNNSFYGKHCGYSNTTGRHNNFFGSHCAYNNTTSTQNCAYGSYAFWSNTTGDSNVVMGNYAAYNAGTDSVPDKLNVYIGVGAVANMYSGDSNVFVGAKSNINSTIGMVNDAGAFGFGAIVTASDKIILGNDTQDIGIGMSGVNVGRGPTNRLEISNYSALYAEPCAVSPPSTFTIPQCENNKTPTGASGLQFRDLTKASIPYFYDSTSAFLTVDDSGNVVLMYAPAGTGAGIGVCGKPSVFGPGSFNDPTINLETNTHNFWFEGNHVTDNYTNVYIGYPCDTSKPPPPKAKLNVLQASESNNTVGIFVENTDLAAPDSNPREPLIGIESYIPAPRSNTYYNAAGWFEADNASFWPNSNTYAIFVPQVVQRRGDFAYRASGGTVDIGFQFASDHPSYLLKVNGTCENTTGIWTSDSTLKTNVNPINNALNIVNKLNGVSFNFIDSLLTDSGTYGTHYGFIAQQVSRVLPNVVKTDNGKCGIAYVEIIPWLTEAIKQEKQTNDSLRSTLDSLRSAVQGMQNCLNRLCGNAPVHPSGGNGNSGDSNTTITNTQDVMLSAATNAPLLYQNIPNPFSTGTKINYYLPEGTIGATMVFYDTYGNQLKSVPLSQTGNGTLNITPDNLSAGIYSYSLIVNNNIIDTKRMLLQK